MPPKAKAYQAKAKPIQTTFCLGLLLAFGGALGCGEEGQVPETALIEPHPKQNQSRLSTPPMIPLFQDPFFWPNPNAVSSCQILAPLPDIDLQTCCPDLLAPPAFSGLNDSPDNTHTALSCSNDTLFSLNQSSGIIERAKDKCINEVKSKFRNLCADLPLIDALEILAGEPFVEVKTESGVHISCSLEVDPDFNLKELECGDDQRIGIRIKIDF